MAQWCVACFVLIATLTAALAASDKQPPPEGSFTGAPAQFTQFTASELARGFLALAFGSDLRIGIRPRGIRRFDRPIQARVISGGSVDRSAAMSRVIEDYARQIPALRLSETSAEPTDIEVRLINERDFPMALRNAFGRRTAKIFVARTDPQCMTSVRSTEDGTIVHAVSFIIVDKGEKVFLDCAYHELLHAFGLSNHDQHNPWTTLNQRRMVGYLTAYDRALLTLLYSPHIRPGMTRQQTKAVLPRLIAELGLASPSADR